MKTPNIHLRPATTDDLAILNHWDKQPHIIESDPNDDWGWEKELGREVEWREQLIAELDGRPIGYVEIMDPAQDEEHYWGDVQENLRAIDIWIGEKEELNKGYGTQMIKQAIERCFTNPKVTTILVDPLTSNLRARRFYERLGFKFVKERRFGQDDCSVYQLKREDWEI